MNNIENKIGYDIIRGQVEALCTTHGAVELFRGETFSSDAEVVTLRQKLADQMRQALMMESGFPSGEYQDLHYVISKAKVEGAFLDVEQVLLLRRALAIVVELLGFFRSVEQDKYPDLILLTREVRDFKEVVNHIDSIIDRFGKVKDNASPELYSVRKEIRSREGQVSKRLQQILAQAQSAGFTDGDVSISVRDGRSVIPVPAANKRKIKGFIHDESATGKTVYIEPIEIVELNNELRELENQERREIVRILTDFTEMLRQDIDEMEGSADFLIQIDMLRAKARFAIANNCVMPILSDDGTLELRSARHPVLEQTLKKENKQIVPLNLKLTKDKYILVISGPNAGGKSVCLKTVGLLQWMYQCGMPVPVLENSQMLLFDRIFVDIGDEQSIENDLSTYSSHLTNMKQMIQKATSQSLVLIDEFGSGTEPVIGGAIAEAILETLESRRCYGVITTHFSNLKYYASNAQGVVNGAMTFDVQNIRPLFALEMGMPGSSFAIEIARKIGLPENIISSASQKAGTDRINIEKQLRDIARDRRYWEQKRDRIRLTDRKVEQLEEKYALQLTALKEQKATILKQARDEAAKITAEANKQIENAIKAIRESQADKEKTRIVRTRLDQFRDNLNEDQTRNDMIEREMEKLAERRKRREDRKAEKAAGAKSEHSVKEVESLTPHAGSKVRIEGQDTIGEIQSIKGKKATVAFGQILTTVELARLTVVSNSEFKKQTRQSRGVSINVSSDVSKRKLNFKHNIDVRGMRAAEALEIVEDFIDDAIMVGAERVTILHGKGTGALKEEIRRFLKSVDMVKSAEDEHVDMGGAGITVVTLR